MTVVEHYAVTKSRTVWKCDLCIRTVREEKDLVRTAFRHIVTMDGTDGRPLARVEQYHLCWRCSFDMEDKMDVMRRTQGAGVTEEEQNALLQEFLFHFDIIFSKRHNVHLQKYYYAK